jgi:3,4-dihydroxy 2-butanone 4-phosphate synthase/GTP cyclohydrolase II
MSRPRSAPISGGSAKQHLYTQLATSLDDPSPGFDSIASALEDLAAGKFVVVLDDEDRENEGDLIIAGDKITTESMHYMIEYTSGVICVAMPGADMDRLRLPLMVDSRENDESMYTAFTVTVDLREGTTTGISAADRAATVRAMADPAAVAGDFRRPGHIFPLRSREGGVIVRPGHTEAAVDLARLAGCRPAGVLCEIVNKEDGSMQRTPQLLAFSKQFGLKCITIADLIRYRLRHEQLVAEAASAPLTTRHGEFVAHVFRSLVDGREHAALVYRGGGSAAAAAAGHHGSSSSSSSTQQQGTLVAVHAQSTLVDVFGSLHQGEAGFLDHSLAAVAAAGAGVVLYINSHAVNAGAVEGEASSSSSGGTMAAELEAYAAAQRAPGANNGAGASGRGAMTDLRDGAAAAHMLRHLGVERLALLSGDEGDAQRLAAFGLEVAAVVVGGGRGGVNGVAHRAAAAV